MQYHFSIYFFYHENFHNDIKYIIVRYVTISRIVNYNITIVFHFSHNCGLNKHFPLLLSYTQFSKKKHPYPTLRFLCHAQDSEGGCFPGTADRTFGSGSVGCVLRRDPPGPLHDFIHPGRFGLL